MEELVESIVGAFLYDCLQLSHSDLSVSIVEPYVLVVIYMVFYCLGNSEVDIEVEVYLYIYLLFLHLTPPLLGEQGGGGKTSY